MSDEMKALEQEVREGTALIQATDKKLTERLEQGLSGAVKREELAKIEAATVAAADRLDEVERKFLAEASKRQIVEALDEKQGRKLEATCLGDYFKSGKLSDDARKYMLAVGSSDNSTAHYVVMPPTMATDILALLRQTSPMEQICDVQTIDGTEWTQVEVTAGGSAGRVTERGTRSETSTATLGEKRITAHGYYVYPTVTQEVLYKASSFDLGAFVMEDGNLEIQELVDDDYIDGNGVGRPFGLTTNATLQAAYTATGSATTITSFDCLKTATGAIHETFLPNARWMMKRSTFITLSTLKNGVGDYLLQPVTSAMPAQLMGYPIVFNGYMPAIADYATNPYFIAFGDFRAGYKIVQSRFMLLIRDEVTSPGYVKLYKEIKKGGDVRTRNGGQAINLVKIAAS